MADARSKFRRPETPTAPILGPDVESFVSGTKPPEPVRAEAAQAVQQLDQVGEKSTKPDPTKRLTIDIPESLHKRVKSQCATQGTTIADIVRALLEKKFPEA